jgi:hypothetical protein
MTPDNLVALAIFGAAAVALFAGLGAWVWEIFLQKAPESPTEPDALQITTAGEFQNAKRVQFLPPESDPRLLDSKFLRPQPQPTPQSKQLGNVPVTKTFNLDEESVKSDASYQESLAEVQEADPPEAPPPPLPLAQGAGYEAERGILSCTGTAHWRSSNGENDKINGTIERAIFRDSFQTLNLELRYPSRDWPAELTMRRDTTSSYTGQAGTRSTDIHCQLVFNTLSGTKIGFKGLWYAYRTDTQACQAFHVTGEIHPKTKTPYMLASSIDPNWTRDSLPLAKTREAEPTRIEIPTRRFSLALGNFRGNPFLEILENNFPWGESHPGAKRHFSFGKKKARMVLTARRQIQAFVEDAGKDPSRHNGEVDADPWLDGSVTICGHEFFQVNQRQIRRHYLQLKFGMESFSFGLSKAEALAYLMPEIENWATRN